MLAIATLGTVSPMLLMPLSRNLALLIGLTFLYACFAGPVAPLTDAAASGRDYGLSYAGYFVGGVLSMSERAPEGLSATAQALFSGTAYGVGAIAGSLAGGFLYDRVGMASLFRICCALSAVTLLAFVLASSRRRAAQD